MIALLLPPAVALAGVRLFRLLLGAEFPVRYGLGLRFAMGLGLGVLVFTQLILLGAVVGFNSAGWLGRGVLVWGFVEFVLLVRPGIKSLRQVRFQKAHLWLLLLLPLPIYFGVLGRLLVLEGTMEFDAIAHWVFKSKLMYLAQGREFLDLMHTSNIAHAHLDYPVLVSALYTLNYGAVGGVNEFVNKVWPLWMVVALGFAVLSLGNVWRRPQPLPIAIVLILCFLPATLRYVQWEGATIPMLFYTSLAALLIVRAMTGPDPLALAASLLILTGCAMTKFEGMLYAALWLAVLLPACWRHRWWKTPALGKTAALAALCLLPYVLFRWNQPIAHIESSWPSVAVHSPGPALHIFPQLLSLGLGGRFFSLEFFKWTADAGQLRWAGHWSGWQTLVNYQLGVLPWFTVFLLGFGWWRRQQRGAIVKLTLVIIGFLAALAFVIACVPHEPGNEAAYILSKTGEDMGRYYFPYFMAWFLGLASTWFEDGLAKEGRAGD